ncbi:hypothetical protein ACTFIU_000164 [Dictyostelium citrinum]
MKEKQFHDSDELLITLNDFIKSNEKDLKNGNICLTLNPICLEQLNLYLNGKRISFKLSKSDLLDLQFIISLIKHLRIDPNEEGLLEKNRDVNLKLFDSIKFLEISYVKPGLITNLFELSQNIEQLTVSGSLNSLDELLIVEDEVRLPYYQSIGSLVFEHEDGQPLSHQELSNKRFQYLYKKNNIWSKLKELDLSFNSIPEIDQSAYSLLSIEKLCFEGNLISKVNNLQECLFLRTLNLSFNMIKDMENINQELGMITHLSLRGNQIEKVESLNRLYALECLDISKNKIKDIQEIFKLNALPNLQYLFVDENPFCDLKDYRNIIISNFLNSDNIIHLLREFYLDGKRISEQEIEFIKKHTHDNGSFKSYKSPIKPIKPPKSKKDIVPLVVEFAPNARIDSEFVNDQNIMTTTTTTTTTTTIGNRKKDTHKHHHPNFNHGKSRAIEPVIDNLPDYDSEVTENQVQDDKFEEEKNLKKKIDDLRSEGGNSWLLVLNEMSTFKENNHPIPEYNENNNNNLSSPVKLVKTPIKSPSKKKNIYHNISNNNNNNNKNNNNNNNSNNNNINDETSPSKLNVTPQSPSSTDTASNVPTIAPTTNIVSPINSSTSSPSSSNTTTTPTTPATTATIPTAAINLNKSTTTPTSTTPISTTPISTTPKSISLLSKSPNTNGGGGIISSELICEPFSVIKNSQNLLLQIKIDTILESNLFGHSVNSYLLKDIVFVFSVPDAVEPNTAEIVFATDFKDGVPIAFSREYYQMEDQQSLHQLLTVLVPPLYREYTMNCMDCSERYVCKSEHDFTHCIKCNSKGLFYLPTTTDRSIMVVESPSASFSNSLSLKDMKKFIEYNDDEFNDRIFKDQSLQLFFKLKVFKGGSKEVYQYIMKSNFVRYTSATSSSSLSSLLEEEKQIFLLLSSTTCYLLKEKKSSDDTSNRFSIQTILPLSEIRRVSVGLSSQLFRIEMDDQCYVFIKRSQECSEKFLKLLFTITKGLGLPLEPYSRAIETKQVINALLLDPNEEFLKYIMLHHKISGRNIVPRSLILSSENIYLTIENYHQYPLLNKNIKTTSSQFTIFKHFKITDIAHIKYSKFKPNYFTIAFENEVNNKPLIEWNLITGNSIECNTMVSTISSLWKEKFHLDIKILDNI